MSSQQTSTYVFTGQWCICPVLFYYFRFKLDTFCIVLFQNGVQWHCLTFKISHHGWWLVGKWKSLKIFFFRTTGWNETKLCPNRLLVVPFQCCVPVLFKMAITLVVMPSNKWYIVYVYISCVSVTAALQNLSFYVHCHLISRRNVMDSKFFLL